MKKVLFFLTAILIASCGSSTSVVSSWKDPNTSVAAQNFKKVLIVALVKNESSRRNTESRIASTNPIFHTSYQFLNQESANLTKEQKMKILQDENVDGVITMRLVSKDKETSYVPGVSAMYGGYGNMYGMYGPGFGGWYGMYGPSFYSPGYYDENTYYNVETSVFSIKENKLIWAATTKTLAGSELDPMIDDIMRSIVDEMKKDGSITK